MTGAAGTVRAHAILGMHRSGTSWLAGSLEEKGLGLGEVNEAAPYNSKGTREHDRVQEIHAAVMRQSGGSWRNPPKRVVWPEDAIAELKAFVDDMNRAHEQWGFKDPRSVFLLDEWRNALPEGLALVGIYRHPRAVARSLAARRFGPVDTDEGIRLWCAYNDALVKEHRREAFPILRFDVEPERLLGALDAVATAWALPDAARRGAFFDQALRHADAESSADVPRSCRKLWSYLEEHQLDPATCGE